MSSQYKSRSRQPEPPQYHGQVKNETTSCLHFEYAAVESATNQFDQRPVSKGGCKLGEGGFGPVFKGELKFTEVAIKVLRRAPPVSDCTINNNLMLIYFVRLYCVLMIDVHVFG